MANSSAKILLENTKWVYIAKIISQLISLAAIILVIRKLTVDIFGTYSLITQSFVVFQIIALGAIDQVFLRYIPELIANKEYRKFILFVTRGLGLTLISFAIFFSILYVFKESFAIFFNISDFHYYIFPFFLYSFTFAIKSLVTVTLHSLLLHKKYAYISILNASVRLVLYLIYHESLTVSLLLYVEVFTASLFILQGTFIYFKHIKTINFNQMSIGKTPVTSKRIIRYGLFSAGNVLGQGIVGRTSDYFIVAALSNPLQVGLYAFAVRVYSMIYQILPEKQFYSVLRPLFFHKFTQRYDVPEFQKILAFMIKGIMPIYLLPLIFFFIFGKNLINLVFDPRYIDAYWIIIILFIHKPLVPFYNTIAFTLQLKERVDIEMYSKIFIIFSIAAGIYGMKTYGLIGIALASTLGLFLQNIFVWVYMRKYPEIRFWFRDYVNYIIIMIFLLPFMFLYYIEFGMVQFILWSAGFIIYFGVIFLIFHPFSSFDIIQLQKMTDGIPALSKTVDLLKKIARKRMAIIKI